MLVLADKALTKFIKSHWSVLVSFDPIIVSQGFCQSHGFRKLGIRAYDLLNCCSLSIVGFVLVGEQVSTVTQFTQM